MIKAIVISDSHGKLSNVKEILRKERHIDAVFHLGDIMGQEEELKSMCDCPLYAVRGNCDYFSPFSSTDIVTLENNRIFMAHGHTFGVNWGLSQIVDVAREEGCNIVMYGHTHIPDITPYGDVMALNPGSITEPRQGEKEPTYIVMTIDEDGKTDCRVKLVRE